MRLIDADKLNIYDVSPADGFVVMGVTEEDIALAPSIDIVRCRECKYWSEKACHKFLATHPSNADDFCSYGEREGE